MPATEYICFSILVNQFPDQALFLWRYLTLPSGVMPDYSCVVYNQMIHRPVVIEKERINYYYGQQ